MTSQTHCTGAIIAGGRATRFDGVAKGLERVGGARIIDRVAGALAEACDDLIVVANDPAAFTWLPGVRVVRDMRPNAAALGGIHAALSMAQGAVVVLSWDSPFVPAGVLRALRAAGGPPGIDAVLPISNSKRGFEPLCAWYAKSCLPSIEKSLDTGDLRSGGWQSMVRAVKLDVSPWGDPDEIFFNVNSAADLAIANAKAPRAI